MTLAVLLIHGGDPTTWVDDAYSTGVVVAGCVVALVALVRAVVAANLDHGVVAGFQTVLFGALAALLWPLVTAVAVVSGLVLALRFLWHDAGLPRRRRRRRPLTDAELAALEREVLEP